MPEAEFNPFITETAIFDASISCIAFSAPVLEDSNHVIKFNAETSMHMAKGFKALLKKV